MKGKREERGARRTRIGKEERADLPFEAKRVGFGKSGRVKTKGRRAQGGGQGKITRGIMNKG